jgi:hypothetical protein
MFTLITITVVTVISGALEVAVPWVTETFFGSRFVEAVPMARALIVAGGFMAIRRVAADCARSMGRPEIDSFSEMAGWPVFIVVAGLLTAASTSLALTIALAVAASSGVAAAVGVARLWRLGAGAGSKPDVAVPPEGVPSW